MIRLGSLAGYPFEGPRLLAGWTAPASPAVYAICYKPEPDTKPDQYAVIYVGHSEDLSAERFPFQHPRAHCWVRRAGSKWKVYICTYEVPGGGPGHREQITRELAAIYQPRCNTERYGQAWKDEWIGEYTSAPNSSSRRTRPSSCPAGRVTRMRLPSRGRCSSQDTCSRRETTLPMMVRAGAVTPASRPALASSASGASTVR